MASMIYPRESVRAAVARALLLSSGDTEAAVLAAAQALGLEPEVVREALAEVEAA